MKKNDTLLILFASLFLWLMPAIRVQAQCNNADFETGDFTGWTGTYCAHECTGIYSGGVCSGCGINTPTFSPGFNQGPNNNSPSDSVHEYNQIITSSAAGNDPYLTSLGVNLPMVWPGSGGYSARIGNMWQYISTSGTGDGESMSYTMVVTPSNCMFTYHYAVAMTDGGHPAGEQAYFTIKMVDGGNNDIACAGYQVDATTCQTIGGFIRVPGALDPLYYKPWSSVLVPLVNYIGQTVTITFTTRSCLPAGCAGSHYAYAYIDCECAGSNLLNLGLTAGGHCGSPAPAITAPAGFGTYTWTGPGVIGPGNTRTISIYQPGRYNVSMTTNGAYPCVLSLDTVAPDSLGFFVANFSTSTGCLDSTVLFTDRSALHDSITSWAWDFNNDGVTDSVNENPTYKFPGVGTYPVKLTITSATCTTDTVINVTVVKQPVVTLTAGPPVCIWEYASILYAVNDPNAKNFTYNWNFDSTAMLSDTGFGGYLLAWNSAGTKNITLTVTDSNCMANPVSVQAVVKPSPNLGLPQDTGFCAGAGSITLMASGANTYSWMRDSTLSDTATAIVIATPDTTTTYYLAGTLNGCSSQSSVTVHVVTAPVFSGMGGVTDSVCANDTLLLGFTCTAPNGSVYTWNLNGGFGQLDTLVANGELTTWPTAGAKTVIVTASAYGCAASDTMIVYVRASPVLTLIGDTTGCIGNTITLTATGATAYVWTVDTLLYTTDSIIISPDTTLANIYVTGTTNGCSTTDAVSVSGNPAPVVAFVTSGQVCIGDTLTITFTGSAVANATFNWNFGYGNANTLTGSGPIRVSWDSIGVCPVSLTVSQYGCVSTFADTIPVSLCNSITQINPGRINIYPNPAKKDFTIEFTGTVNTAELQIYDVLGQVLYVDEIRNVTTGYSKQIHLDVAGGVYFISLREGDKYYTQKLVIE